MILEQIIDQTKERITQQRRQRPLAEVRAEAEAQNTDTGFPFEKALAKPGMSFICEVKKASPSKGVIDPDFPYLEIAWDYQAAGADALSVLTEPFFFRGSNEIFREIRARVPLPMLRKDFTVDEYMIYEAKTLGADAILLICAVLSDGQLQEYLGLASALGMNALVEAHDEKEISRALHAGAGILGVNNRNLKDFTVDIGNSVRLRKMVPAEVLFVSESGMRTREDIKCLEENGTSGVLIGETLMRSREKAQMLAKLRG